MVRLLLVPIIAGVLAKPLCVLIALTQYMFKPGLGINMLNVSGLIKGMLDDINTNNPNYAIHFFCTPDYYTLHDVTHIIFLFLSYQLVIKAVLDTLGITHNHKFLRPPEPNLNALSIWDRWGLIKMRWSQLNKGKKKIVYMDKKRYGRRVRLRGEQIKRYREQLKEYTNRDR